MLVSTTQRLAFRIANTIALASLCASLVQGNEIELSFEKNVRPILKAQCFHCHGEGNETNGGLDVRLVRLMQSGGESGASIVPGRSNDSLLWQRIESDEMPEGSKKLSREQKNIIRRWIDQGAQTLRPEPENVEDARFSHEELSHWAWQRSSQPAIPSVASSEIANPIDSFIAKAFERQGLAFSTPADRRTLIRRLSFNLLGIPPSVEQVAQFVGDQSPTAYDRLVEQMLASPQFGVRWGRHWLDVAGFAETNDGFTGDSERPHAWRYRDYVVDSFNANKPIDQFFIEQLAGDELIDGDVDRNDTQHLHWLTATGFLRMGPDSTQRVNDLESRNTAVAETIKIVSSAMLGITVGCAQCHDHKYDAIGIDDYYSFRAIFDPAFPLASWQQPNSRVVDFTPEEVNQQRALIEADAAKLDADLVRRRTEHAKRIQEQKLADVPEPQRDAARQAVLTEPGQRNAAQKELLDLYPMVKPVSHILGLLIEYDMPAYRKFEKEAKEIAALRATKPPSRMVMVTSERPGNVPESKIFHRGNPSSPAQRVSPNELAVLCRGRDVAIAAQDHSRPTTGRRLAYARQLTDGTHPLAARVFVNRVWHHHFGSGLVATLGDFGMAGDRPTHPQLLDWLADDFVRHGWDHKRLHRLIVTSRTFQQVSTRTPQLDQIDPENLLLARMNVRRLEAEAIRDAIVMATDSLEHRLGGPAVPVTENSEGKVVLGRRLKRDGINAGVDDSGAAATRRSIYVQVKRGTPLNMLATFDQPEMTPNCETRRSTTVATQSLWFLNDAEILQRSRQLAELLVAERRSTDERIEMMFLRLFARSPSKSELVDCNEFLESQRIHLRRIAKDESKKDANLQSLAVLCQTLFASNQFLYVD